SNVVSKRANNGLKDHCFLKNNYINKNKQTLRINLRKVCLRSETAKFLYKNFAVFIYVLFILPYPNKAI
ncbi:hypothetical protein, partial [Mammaliicoccus lentus]|uniref:hypothetical protein n=1 Tax=Mammaliicoccus lentus TaxID=42858 RepID=UPI002DBB65D9